MKKAIQNFSKYRYLLIELVKKDIKLKYRNSVLGLLWTMLEPLLTMFVLTMIFEHFRQNSKVVKFPVYVLCGRLIYAYFANGTRLALKSIRRNSTMIRKVYVPKYMYPLSSALSGYVTFLISLIVLVAVAAVLDLKPTWYLLQAVFPLGTIVIMVTGVGFCLATLDVFFRDAEYLWGVILTLIMYMSAIFFDGADFIKTNPNGFLVKYNPLYGVIVNFRHSIYGEPMEVKYFLYSFGVSLVFLVIGIIMFYRKQDKFVLYI